MKKRQELFKMKLMATGLLLLVMILFIFAHLQHDVGIWPWVAAFAEAAMIGALADWFAVVALFKRPMGLPIPHTAIIPQNKNRIADSLAIFVREKFLDIDSLLRTVRKFNPADKLTEWLQRKENTELIGARVVQALSGSLEFADDARIKRVLDDAIRHYVGKMDLAKSAGGILDVLTAEHRHQELLNEGIDLASAWINQQKIQKRIAAYLAKWLADEYPGFSAVLPTHKFGNFAAPKIIEKINELLRKVQDDPVHELRGHFDVAVQKLVIRLKSDAEFQRRGEIVKQKLLNDPALNHYLNDLWHELKSWLRHDLNNQSSLIRQNLIESGRWLGDRLAQDMALRSAINEHIEISLRKLEPELALSITSHISSTVKSWDDHEISREIELNIGKDLQFIRLNGTLVGGVIGLLIYAIAHFF